MIQNLEEMEKRIKELEDQVSELIKVFNELLGDDESVALIMQKKKTEWLQKENLKENCKLLGEILDEIEKAKINFSISPLRNWLIMLQNSKNPNEGWKRILSNRKLKIGDIINIFEKNKDTLIREIRGFGPTTYERFMKIFKEQASKFD